MHTQLPWASTLESLACKDVLPEQDLLEKAATKERFGYLLLGKKLQAQTDIAKKQHQGLDKAFISQKNKKMWMNH